jgi:transposase
MVDKRYLDYSVAIHESVEDLHYCERHQKKALLRDRIRFLRLLKSGECTTQGEAGRVIGLGLRAAEKLMKKYRDEGLEGLLVYPYEGKREKISPGLKQDLQAELQKDKTQSLWQVQHFLEQQGGVHYTLGGVHYMLRRMGVKKKTGRPQYYDKDSKGEERFKKKSSRR